MQDLVTFVVGPEKKEFVVHKSFVCHASSVLRAAFNSNFLEGQTQRYVLEDTTEAASTFSRSGSIHRNIHWDGESKNEPTSHSLPQAWVLAEKLLVPNSKIEWWIWLRICGRYEGLSRTRSPGSTTTLPAIVPYVGYTSINTPGICKVTLTGEPTFCSQPNFSLTWRLLEGYQFTKAWVLSRYERFLRQGWLRGEGINVRSWVFRHWGLAMSNPARIRQCIMAIWLIVIWEEWIYNGTMRFSWAGTLYEALQPYHWRPCTTQKASWIDVNVIFVDLWHIKAHRSRFIKQNSWNGQKLSPPSSSRNYYVLVWEDSQNPAWSILPLYLSPASPFVFGFLGSGCSNIC